MGYTEVLIASLYFISFAIPWSPQKGSSIGWLIMKCSVDPIKIPLEQTFTLESETWAPTVPPFGFVFVFYTGKKFV